MNRQGSWLRSVISGIVAQEQRDMSFKSDTSFPERNLDDPRQLSSQRRSQPGPMHAFVADRDRQELWAVLRSFRQTYGAAALHQVIADAEKS